MFPALEDVKKRRKRLKLTQKQLAEQCGVSQSTIAKIEAKTINPSYKIMRKIFTTLQKLEAKQEKKKKAKDCMTPNVVDIDKEDTIQNAVKKMKKHDYSQLPVTSEGQCVGSISEATILKLVAQEEGDFSNIYDKKVKELMNGAFPRVGKNTPLSAITTLLRKYAAVLVTENEEIIGIITKADLLDIQSSP